MTDEEREFFLRNQRLLEDELYVTKLKLRDLEKRLEEDVTQIFNLAKECRETKAQLEEARKQLSTGVHR